MDGRGTSMYGLLVLGELLRRSCVGGAIAALGAVHAACGGTTGADARPVASARASDASPLPESSADSADDASPSVAANADPTMECDGDWIVADGAGFVSASSNRSGITGRWSVHSDCDDVASLEAGAPSPGSNCSMVTAPMPDAAFVPDPTTGGVCTSGSTVQVFSPDEWPTRWGAYIALDLRDVAGVATDFNASAAGVRGFCLYISGDTIPAFRVRLPSDQSIANRDWYQQTFQHEGWHRVLFSDLGQVTPSGGASGAAFDATKVTSIEVEIPSSEAEVIPWDFCVEGLVALR